MITIVLNKILQKSEFIHIIFYLHKNSIFHNVIILIKLAFNKD